MRSSPDARGTGSPATLPSTNGINSTLRRLSLNAASATAHPQAPSPHRTVNYPPSPSGKFASRSPLPRSPSSMSLDRRSSTPGLHRKASMNSLHGVGGVTPPRPSPSRRSSSAQPVGTAIGKSPLSGTEITTEPEVPTAASIASAYFKKELELHEEFPADTIVI